MRRDGVSASDVGPRAYPARMDLFDAVTSTATGLPAVGAGAPLAVRMRPRDLGEVAGQEHLLVGGSPLRRLVEPANEAARRAAPTSVVLWGPPGTGKTTLAYLIAATSGRRFVELSAVTAGVKDVRAVIEDARRRLATDGTETVLFIDEVHRFTKAQQDALLPSVENRWVTLVAATTENPSFSVNSPLLSRSLLLTLQPLDTEDVRRLVRRAVEDERGSGRLDQPVRRRGGAPAPAGRRGRAQGADHPRGRRRVRPVRGRRRPARRRWTSRRWSGPSTSPRCATTATATSTTTSSARSSSRCAAPTSTPRCTTSRG